MGATDGVNCVHCGATLPATSVLCTVCGGEQDASPRIPPVAPPIAPGSAPTAPSDGQPTAAGQVVCVCGASIPAAAAECPYCFTRREPEAVPDPTAAWSGSAVPVLVLADGGSYPLPGSGAELVAGREDSPMARSLAPFDNVSRAHAAFRFAAGRVLVTDQGSTNGTFVNGVQIAAGHPRTVSPGDELRLGRDCVVRVVFPEERS